VYRTTDAFENVSIASMARSPDLQFPYGRCKNFMLTVVTKNKSNAT
jgi:hypothetical protein